MVSDKFPFRPDLLQPPHLPLGGFRQRSGFQNAPRHILQNPDFQVGVKLNNTVGQVVDIFRGEHG